MTFRPRVSQADVLVEARRQRLRQVLATGAPNATPMYQEPYSLSQEARIYAEAEDPATDETISECGTRAKCGNALMLRYLILMTKEFKTVRGPTQNDNLAAPTKW